VVLRSRLEGALCQFFILLWIAAQLFQNDGLIAFTGVIGLGMFLAWTNSNHKREQYTDKMGALDLASRTLWAPPSAVAV
jgi:hypothetical protein